MELDRKGYPIGSDGKRIHRKIVKNIPKGWVVHHIDHVKTNNDPSNLISLPFAMHDRMHQLMKKMNRILSREEIENTLNAYLKTTGKLRERVSRIDSEIKVLKKERREISNQLLLIEKSGNYKR